MAGVIEFLVSLGALTALAFLPGVLLTYGLFPGKRLDIFERIPIGFGLVCGVLAGLFFLARVFAWGWRELFTVWLALILLEIVIIFVLPRVRLAQSFTTPRVVQALANALPRAATYDEAAASRPAARILVGLLAALLGLGAFLTHIVPNDLDDWNYFQFVRQFADATRFAPVSLNDRNVAHAWWLLHAAIVRAGDVDVVRLGRDWMPLLFVPMSLLAFYALARALFLNRNLAIAAVALQFLFLFADLFNPDEWIPWPGWWFFARLDQDHTIVIFLFLPVFAALIVWYLREGGWALLGVTLIAQASLIAVHALMGIALSALTLFGVLLIELVFARQPQARARVVWLFILSVVVFGGLAPIIPMIFRLLPPSFSALRLVGLADGVFPFSYYHYTFFSPTIFTLRIDFLGQPPALTAMVLTLGLILFLRKNFAARFLFVISAGVLVVLYCPPILQFLESRMTATVLRLWSWNPKALVIAYFLPSFYLVARDGWSALRERTWNTRARQAAMLFVVLIALLALWLPYLRRDLPPALGAGHALPNGAPEMLKALRDQTTPGELSVVLAWRDITDAIPAYRATLTPMLFREDPNGQARRDASIFVSESFVTTEHLRVLNAYQVRYLIVSGEREITSQYDLLPEYFQPLYRNVYGALYRVKLPLESNDLVEANAIANYGEWEGAIEAYNAVLAKEPNDSLAHTGLGIVLQLLNRPKAAVRELEAAVSAAPQNMQAHYHLVYLYHKLGMDEEAVKHVQSAGQLLGNSDSWRQGK